MAGAGRAGGAKPKPQSGPKATPGNPSPTTSRAAKHQRARAAGAAGQPAPPWIDDADLLSSYDAGATSLGPAWAGDTAGPTPQRPAAPAASPEAAGLPLPAGAPAATPAPTGSTTASKAVTSGAQGDVAGAFLGIFAAAFAVNVIKGSWQDWLRAKFLNKVTQPAAKEPPPMSHAPDPQFWQKLFTSTAPPALIPGKP